MLPNKNKLSLCYFYRIITESSLDYKNIMNIFCFKKEHANFAHEYMQSLKLDEYRGIIVISGDGLVYEVINGLMSRPDWQEAIKTPIAQIPGGSANALACVCAYLTGECYLNISLEKFAIQTAFHLTKSVPCPIDLVTCRLADNTFVHSFLAIEWAIVADVDLESEKYRFLGSLRFTVGAIKRILNLRVYRGRLSFLLYDESKSYEPKNSSIKLIQKSETANNQPFADSLPNRPVFKYLPNSLEDPLPSNWITIEENFVFFLVSYLPLIAPDFIASPESTFNDECMHLTFVKEGITKLQLLQLFLMSEKGTHLQNPFLENVKIKAFRLEPLPLEGSTHSEGVMMIDGERVPYGKLQAELKPGLGNILVNKNV